MNHQSAVTLAALLALATPTFAQFKLVENFDGLTSPSGGAQGPPSLTAAGWIFRNQSSPIAGAAWRPGGSPGWPQAGAGFLEADSSATGLFGAKLSSWAILPAVPGVVSGDLLTIWVLGGNNPSFSTFLDVRYSPSGGTDSGSGPFDVGDFTDVLFSGELSLSQQFVYEPVEVALPGAGRVAVRFHAPVISNFQSTTPVWLDSLTVGGAAPPACGIDLPVAGGTVHWNAAGSPYTICQPLTVPVGATLVLDAGTTVVFDPGTDLLVEGTLLAQGTVQAPVTLSGNNVSGLRVYGQARFDFADVDAGISVHTGSSFESFDSTFRFDAGLSALTSGPCFIRLVRTVLGTTVSINGTSVWEDVTVPDPTSFVAIRGFWNIASLDSFAPLVFGANLQDRVVDNVAVSGVSGPALELTASEGSVDFQLGPNNVLLGNEYPLWPRHVGLRSESYVPTSGNINDAILGFENVTATIRSRPSLPDFGIPYHFLERGTASGDIRIAPGAQLFFGPEGGLTVTADRYHDPVLRGLPGQPIQMGRLFPNQQWLSLSTLFGLTLFEHLSIDGAGAGVVSNAELLLRDCTISNCAFGAFPAADGQIYGSGVRFLWNDVGLQNDTTNLAGAVGTGIHFSGTERPNVFEGNLLAANNVPGGLSGFLHPFPTDNNWWGHPTGPFEANFHPQGQGDPVSFGVDFQPFLTSAPNLSDARPVVRMKTRLHPVILPGEKIFIEWEASDDGVITEFDVQVLSDDINAPYQTYVDLVSNLPGSARRCELIVPVVGLHPYERFPFRIVARDDAGNVGFEQFQLAIPHQTPAGVVTFNTPLSVFQGGESLTVCYDSAGFSSSFPTLWIETASDDRVTESGAGFTCVDHVKIPFASTDRARIGIRAEGNFNRDEWYFSDYFTIRPDARIGDAPPTIQMTAPLAGDVFVGGGKIHIAWTAADDLGLHEIRIQVSFNGGYSFHTIAPSLPGTQTSYTWKLPPSSGVNDLRIRVVAVDTLLQNTADGDDRVLRVLPRGIQRAGSHNQAHAQ